MVVLETLHGASLGFEAAPLIPVHFDGGMRGEQIWAAGLKGPEWILQVFYEFGLSHRVLLVRVSGRATRLTVFLTRLPLTPPRS